MKKIAAFFLLSILTLGAYCQEIDIRYEDNAQVEIAVLGSMRILIDVYNPSYLSAPVTNNDILLTSHFHDDHYKKEFAEGFVGKKIEMEPGELETSICIIESISGSHSTSSLPAEKGSNYIFIIDIADIRIVHFGDQEPRDLTDELLASLGKVDIAFMQFGVEPEFSSMIETIKPALVIPTHLGPGAAKQASRNWKSYWNDQGLLLNKESIPVETSFIFMGISAKGYGKILKLKEWARE